MLNINCSRCGQGLKNVFYYKGQPYGCECFKSVAGIDVNTYARMKKVEAEKKTIKQFIEDNPIIYVVLDADYEINVKELKELGYQKRLGYYVGFAKVDYHTISFMTKEVFRGFQNGLYSINTKILSQIESAQVKVVEDKQLEKENSKKVVDTIKTDNLTIEVLKGQDDELQYRVITNTNATFTIDEYGNYENTKGIKGIRKIKQEIEENLYFPDLISKYKFN